MDEAANPDDNCRYVDGCLRFYSGGQRSPRRIVSLLGGAAFAENVLLDEVHGGPGTKRVYEIISLSAPGQRKAQQVR